MQQTPYQHINHHYSGRHVFTVAFQHDDELYQKQFTPTTQVSLEQALKNAVKYRDSVLGEPGDNVQSEEEKAARRFLARLVGLLETPSEEVVNKPTVAVTKPTVTRTRPVVMDPVVVKPKMGRPRIDHQSRLARLTAPNARYPSLPGGVYPRWTTNKGATPYLTFEVSIRNSKGHHRVKTLYVGLKGAISLKKYRVVRHVAIAYREEFVLSQQENRPLDVSLFVRWQDKLTVGTFHKPFMGSLPRFTSAPGVNRRDIARLNKTKAYSDPYIPLTKPDTPKKTGRKMSTVNTRWPFLPPGVTVRKETGVGMDPSRKPAVLFSVTYRNPKGRTSTRSFFIGTVGTVVLERYRLVRHVAICFRKEYVAAVEEQRPMRIDLFVDWYKKVCNGTFAWPYTKAMPVEWYHNKTMKRKAAMKTTPRKLTAHGSRLARLITAVNVRYPGLPAGVVPFIMPDRPSAKRRRAVLIQCSYRDYGSPATQKKSFYVSAVGNLSLVRYRIARFAAKCLREEYINSVREKRPMRMELFKDWYDKIKTGTFHWPYSGTLPVEPTAAPKEPPRHRKTAIAVLGYLTSVPELQPVMANLDTSRMTRLVEEIRQLIDV